MFEQDGYRIKVLGSDPGPLMALFRSVADERQWAVGNQLEAYVGDSVFLMLEHEGAELKPVGGVQVVMPNNNGFPIETAWPEIVLRGKPDVCDFALTVLDVGHRARHLHWMMHAEAWRYVRSVGVETIYAEIPPRVLRGYKHLGMPFEVVGQPREHWGELTNPCRTTITAMLTAIQGWADGGSAMHQKVIAQALRV